MTLFINLREREGTFWLGSSEIFFPFVITHMGAWSISHIQGACFECLSELQMGTSFNSFGSCDFHIDLLFYFRKN